MTVYVDNPFRGLGGGMRNPTPYGGGIAGGLMNRPPPFMPRPMPQGPQMPMDEGYDGSGFMGRLMARMPTPSRPPPQMPRRMPGGPSKGGNTTPPPIQGPMRGPQMPRPPMQRPGGPGKGRPRGGLMRRGRGRPMPGGPGKGRGQPQMPMPDSLGKYPARPPPSIQGQIGQPQQSFMGRVANNMPEAPFNAHNRPMGRVGNNMPRFDLLQQRPLPSNMEYGMGFYGGGITDLY